MKAQPVALLLAVAVSTAGGWAAPASVALPRPAPITKLKTLYPQTVLARGGRAHCRILVPDSPAYRPLAQRASDIIRRSAGALPEIALASRVVDDQWRIDFQALGSLNIIALGNVNDNRLLSVLYGQRYVVADSIYPGHGGYVVRTVHDPFARGINVLALEGSDPEGVGRALEVFGNRYAASEHGDLILPDPIVDVAFERRAYRFFPDASHSLSSKRQPQYTGLDWFREQWRQAGLADENGQIVSCRRADATLVTLNGAIARLGQTYFRTGDPKLPPLMKELLDKNRHLLSRPEPVNEMQPRSAWHVPQWDLLEELPVWTDRDRLDITNALLRDAALGHERRAFHGQVADGAVMAMDENHGTASARNSFVAWQYFNKYYPSAASDYWMRCARAVFAAQASTFQIPEDSCGYLCYCPLQTEDYALRSGDLTYFRRGVARKHARYIAMACVNNLGLGTGFGDSPAIVYPGVFEALAPAAWFYRDPKLYWVLRNKLHVNCGLRIFQNSLAFDLSITPQEPIDWTGLIRIPLYETPLLKGQSSARPVFADDDDLDPKRFNKLVFRENWSADGQYLLLDGAGAWGETPGPHGHKHDDINTIINFTAQGRMWLVDHTYPLRAFKDHSGVRYLRDGVGGYPKRTLATLMDLKQSPAWGLSRTRFNNWERAVFWRKGRYFIVLDSVVADAPGDYYARCTFRSLGKPMLRNGALTLEQQGRWCGIYSDGEATVDLETHEFTDSQWRTFYPYAEPTVRIVEQDKHAHLQAGERITFANALFAYSTPEQEDAVTVRLATDRCAVVTDHGRSLLVGVDEAPGGVRVGGPFVLSPDEVVTATGATPTPAEAERALTAAKKAAARRAQRMAQTKPASRVKGLRLRVLSANAPVHDLRVADINGDGKQEWLAASDDGLALFDGEGRLQWRAARGTVMLCLDATDIDGDGKQEIVAGGADHGVRLFDGAGNERWRFECQASQSATDGPPAVNWVRFADLEGDGKPEIIAGANWVHVLETNGKLRWEKYMVFRRGRITGDFTAGDVGDLDGDGRQEIVAFFRASYPVAVVYDANGRVIMPADGGGNHGGLNTDNAFACVTLDLFGTGKERQIVYGGRRQVGFLWRDQQPREQAGGKQGGDFVALAWQPVARGKRPLLFAADDMTGIRAIQPEPRRPDRWITSKVLWRQAVEEKVSALAVGDTDGDGVAEVVAGTKLGSVFILNPTDGSPQAWTRRHAGQVTCLAVAPDSGEVLAGCSDGTVLSISSDSRS